MTKYSKTPGPLTWPGSPPKAAMFPWTHCRAATWASLRHQDPALLAWPAHLVQHAHVPCHLRRAQAEDGLFGWVEHQHEERRLKYQGFSFIQTSSGSLKEG